jgi:Leu/Phe-tRNA-protein transferase
LQQDFLYLIDKNDIKEKNTLINIYSNTNVNYYLSDDFSKEFYILLAKTGFISTSIFIDNLFYLLPEIQFEYAILDFDNLHINKRVKKLINQNNFEFLINKDINKNLEKLNDYHKDNWLTNKYKDLIVNLYKNPDNNFSILSIELYDKNSKELIAGEIGYKINSTYTSLSGFSSKDENYKNWGKLQMVLLDFYLEKNNFSFWNLGHPYMQYKFDLGAKLYSREDFLKRWLTQIQ